MRGACGEDVHSLRGKPRGLVFLCLPFLHTAAARFISFFPVNQVIDLVEDVFDSDEGKAKDFLYQNYVNG